MTRTHFFSTTVFGVVVRWVSGNKILQYPDEIDLALWKKACQLQASKTPDGLLGQETPDQAKEESPIEPEILIVNWYGPDDPENPQNWPCRLKHLITLQICVLNFAVYMASSIYVPGEASLVADFDVSTLVATLRLSLFTVGYSLGPMLWSPASELPVLGRTPIFLSTLLLFVLFQLPVGLAPNVAVFLVFRGVTGFFGSPCLSTGGGTITDMYPPTQTPYFLCVWSWAGVLGPIFGPVIGGYLAPAEGWRSTIWLVTCMCAAVFVVMVSFFPETSAENILYRRAKRLRKATGRDTLRSRTEIDHAHHTLRDTLVLLGRAFTLTFSEPIVLLMDLYAGLLYGLLFVWFESFPLVFGDIYHFTVGQQGLVYFGILVFTPVSAPLFLLWLNKGLIPRMMRGGFKPEMMLPPTFVGAFALPVCLFWFGWSVREDVHWIVPIVGSGVFAVGVVALFNSVYMYIGSVYVRYAASIFAGAALFRAAMGATFPLFARALFTTLDVGGGNSLLAGISILFIPVPFVFYRYGEQIRGWSKHAG